MRLASDIEAAAMLSKITILQRRKQRVFPQYLVTTLTHFSEAPGNEPILGGPPFVSRHEQTHLAAFFNIAIQLKRASHLVIYPKSNINFPLPQTDFWRGFRHSDKEESCIILLSIPF
jgi:hypothetical protein